MMMRKITLFYCFLIVVVYSCSKDDPPQEKIITRPAGKYISGIRGCNNNLFMRSDTVKLLEFEYDVNRYLKEMKYYSYRTQQLELRKEYFYNKSGQVNQIDTYDSNNILETQEFFTYENEKLVLSEVYSFESGSKTFSEKYQFITDSFGRVSEVISYEINQGSWVKRSDSRKYTYDSNGNVKKDFWQVDNYQRTAELDFDKKINPFYDLHLPYSYYALPYFSVIYCLSKNNFTGYKLTTITDIDDARSGYMSVNYKYDNNYPIVMDGSYFLKYIDLK